VGWSTITVLTGGSSKPWRFPQWRVGSGGNREKIADGLPVGRGISIVFLVGLGVGVGFVDVLGLTTDDDDDFVELVGLAVLVMKVTGSVELVREKVMTFSSRGGY
jgi:hypothetical protein